MSLSGRSTAHTVTAFKLRWSPHHLTCPSTSPDKCILPSQPWEDDKLPLSRGALQYSAVRPCAAARAPTARALAGGTTGRTHQRFHAIYFHERRAGGVCSSTEKPAEVPLAAKDRLGVSLSKGPFGRRCQRWFLMAGRKEPATWDLCIFAQKAANTTSTNMHATKIIPHSRQSSDFNPDTHQLLRIPRLRWSFFSPWCPPAWHRHPNIALCSPTPRLTCTVPVSSTRRSRLAAFILTAQNRKKKKVKEGRK